MKTIVSIPARQPWPRTPAPTPPPAGDEATDRAILEIGRVLRTERYAFAAVTPETMRRVRERRPHASRDRGQCLRDVFGWNRAFLPASLPAALLDRMTEADLLTREGPWMRSRVRFATHDGHLFAHSAYPTVHAESVFFGPDTHRFCALLQRWAPARIGHLVDVGAGSGAGGLSIARRANRVVLADVNPRAVAMARVNAALASVNAECVESDVLHAVEGEPDVIVANPPYMRDAARRLYRDGGGSRGEGLSVRIVDEAMARLAHGGTLIVYTGTAVIDGVDMFMHHLLPVLERHRVGMLGPEVTYEEIDPDVFGEELDQPAHADTERIAIVGLRIKKP